jgi:hypothetical protein
VVQVGKILGRHAQFGMGWRPDEVGFGVAGVNSNDQIHIGNSWFILAQGSADQGAVDEGIDILGVKQYRLAVVDDRFFKPPKSSCSTPLLYQAGTNVGSIEVDWV